MDKYSRVLYSAEDISKAVRRLAIELNKRYKGQSPIFVGVLTGAFIFTSDLVRQLAFTPKITFVRLVSYEGIRSSGVLKLEEDIDLNIHAQSVVIIEDIIDTGLTIKWLKKHVLALGASSVEVCALFSRCETFTPEYVGFELKTKKFLVGYGLDFENLYRNFPYVIEINKEANSEVQYPSISSHGSFSS